MTGASSGVGAAVVGAVADAGGTPVGVDRVAPGGGVDHPEDVAGAVVFALGQPPGCEVRELVVCPSLESSWP